MAVVFRHRDQFEDMINKDLKTCDFSEAETIADGDTVTWIVKLSQRPVNPNPDPELYQATDSGWVVYYKGRAIYLDVLMAWVITDASATRTYSDRSI